jgi:hypothetical protein
VVILSVMQASIKRCIGMAVLRKSGNLGIQVMAMLTGRILWGHKKSRGV